MGGVLGHQIPVYDIALHYKSSDTEHSLLVDQPHLGNALAAGFHPGSIVSKTTNLIKNYIIKIQTQFGKTVKFVRHDGAREFATNSLKMFYEEQGIEQQTTVPYAHRTNGTAERAIRTIVTIGRSLLHHAKLDKCFRAEAAKTAIYIKNRHPSLKAVHKTSSRSSTTPSQVSSTCEYSDVRHTF